MQLRRLEPLTEWLTHGWNDWGLNLFIDAPHPVEEQPVMAE